MMYCMYKTEDFDIKWFAIYNVTSISCVREYSCGEVI